MLGAHTIQSGSVRLIMIRLLASPAQSFSILKVVDFSLAFASSSISTYQIPQSQEWDLHSSG